MVMIQKRELLHIWKELDINQNKYTMDKEDIEKAAAEYANEACRPLWRTGNEQVCMADFIEGAKWRINTVWHYDKSMPNINEPFLLIDHKWALVLRIGYERDWAIMIKDKIFVKWAYIKDLIPTED